MERKLKEAEAREEALLRRITEKEKALNKMRYDPKMLSLISLDFIEITCFCNIWQCGGGKL